jgi:hypothetical protein
MDVPGIEAAVAELRSRGIAFEEARHAGAQDGGRIATEPGGIQGPMLKNSEANPLAPVQLGSPGGPPRVGEMPGFPSTQAPDAASAPWIEDPVTHWACWP